MRAFRDALRSLLRRPELDTLSAIAIDQELRQIRAQVRERTPQNPMLQGFKVYSQIDEDGIIEAIFERIGTQTRFFVEIGAANGLENNTHYLLHKGWRGVWIEASRSLVAQIRASTGAGPAQAGAADLCVFSGSARRDNIDAILARCLASFDLAPGRPEVDFLSLDIDGNDLHVLGSISVIRPRVICVEYNAKFPPPLALGASYDERRRWASDDYFGASLQAYVDELAKRDYSLVCCNASGANAFFVQNAAVKDAAIHIYAPKELYQEARYHLVRKRSGHPASLAYLARKQIVFLGEASS